MKCLCCGKPIKPSPDPGTENNCWHPACIRKFFGTKTIPTIDLNQNNLALIVSETVHKGYTVPGVQKKLSLHLSNQTSKDQPRLTIVDYPSGYILKPQTEAYPCLPEAEYLVMHMAKATGIQTVPFGLIPIENDFAYITKRIDRQAGQLLAMEDFCQLDGRLTADKYKGSYERCAKIISHYSDRKQFDLSELFLRLIFCYAIGNSDMHLKNFSLIETAEGSRSYHLSEAYDLLPVNVILPEDTEAFALTMCGKKSRFKHTDFMRFAASIDFPEKSAEKIINLVKSKASLYLDMIQDSYLSDEIKQRFAMLVVDRVQRLL